MNDLALLAINAHGGLDRWGQMKSCSARLLNGGVLWGLKYREGVIADVNVRVDLRREWASHQPFTAPDLRTSVEPQRVAIETIAGKVVKERLRPRESFTGHLLNTPWDDLQLAYFIGYAMWTYLNTPFLFAIPGVETEEMQPWQENGETWRRLRVAFPPSIATHSAVQTFYFDKTGLLKRHDYDVEISGGSPAAHYVSDFKEVSGIVLPTRRKVVGRQPNGIAIPNPVIVSIELTQIEFS